MTKIQLLNLLTKEVKKYHHKALASISSHAYMNNLSAKDLLMLIKKRKGMQRIADALLIDFINTIGTHQGMDYDLHTKDLK